MKCIFCGNGSNDSKSVEHIIPQSFGNSTAILPKGVVCDKCNNYIGRKIESPLLNSKHFLLLRQELAIKNKNNKIVNQFDYPRRDEFVQQITPYNYLLFSKEDKTETEIRDSVEEYVKYVKSNDYDLLKPNILMSRLLAKMALEAFIFRCGAKSAVCDYVREDEAFTALRTHVRYDGRKLWDYSARRIYLRSAPYNGNPHESINWEFDFLFMPNGEVYFIIVLFGIEYAINLGGPSIEGYMDWLKNNNNVSPLYISQEARRESYMQYANKMFPSNASE